ncbi:sensor histidine kinase [Streptomyces sp. NPDC087866]|uniref:sensor histidine kinase n=1 Tax=unclassified Streptomyces TaxID=2593676 RepID=UPI0033BD065E
MRDAVRRRFLQLPRYCEGLMPPFSLDGYALTVRHPGINGLRRPLAVDTGIALAYLACALLLGQQDTREGYPRLGGVGLALTCVINLALVARRRAPVTIAAVVYGVWALYVALGHWPAVNSLASLLALYTVAAARPLRTAVAAAVALGAIWVYAGYAAPHGSVTAAVAMAVVFPAILVRFGQSARQSEQRGERLAELTRQLRAERDEQARRAVAEEQARIARELHDVIAHHMSVISVQSGLARYVFTTSPDTARTALTTIEATSREALMEMRRMLTLLRGRADGALESYEPVPGLDGLGELVRRVRSGGVPVELIVEGPERALPPGIGLCAYRVVQEALTNVLKHARPASAEVRVSYATHELRVSVTDDGAGEGKRPYRTEEDGHGTGHGLIGIRERVRLYGGTVEIGPCAEGGFQVRLALPTSAPPGREGAGG